MRRLTCRWMLVVFTAGFSYLAFAQNVPAVPAVNVSTPNRVLDLKADDVCAIDFKNIVMFGANPNITATLKNGSYKHQSGSKYDSTELNDVFCFQREGGERRAFVITQWITCIDRCAIIGVIQLFELRASNPVITQQIVFGAHADGAGAKFDENALTLTVTGRSDDGSLPCCARSLDKVIYHWEGTEFKQASYERIPVPESRILVSVQDDKVESSSVFSTCLRVYRNGRFQMGQVGIFLSPGVPKFFADSLPDDSLKALDAIIEAPGLEELGTIDTPPVPISEGEKLFADIYRDRGKQQIRSISLEAPKSSVPRSFPAPLDPLIQWIHTTSKDIKQRKLPPLKNVKSAGACWPEEH